MNYYKGSFHLLLSIREMFSKVDASAHIWKEKRTYDIAIVNGTISIISKALRSPKELSAAYDSAPAIPAPPVPEDHVDTTFLKV